MEFCGPLPGLLGQRDIRVQNKECGMRNGAPDAEAVTEGLLFVLTLTFLKQFGRG
jgi:hypothetical protein